MLEQTRKRELLLSRQNHAREVTMDAANDFETWLVDAERIVARSMEAVPPLTQASLTGNARLTQWTFERLEEQRNLHETFFEERMEDGAKLLKTMDDCLDDLMRVWPEISVEQPLSSDSELVHYTREVNTRVQALHQRYTVRYNTYLCQISRVFYFGVSIMQ